MVTDLARPDGNLTGIASGATQIVAKRIEILRSLVPKLRRVWFIYRAGDRTDAAAVASADEAAKYLKVELLARSVETADELKRILREVQPGDSLLAPETDGLDITAAILEKSLKARIPAAFATAHWVSRGGLVSYGPDLYAQGLQAAGIVARILQGARPHDLPVESADDIALAVNLETARLLKIDVPRKILFRADVIQR
jgi:putative ABC transport system substrate-binding protein